MILKSSAHLQATRRRNRTYNWPKPKMGPLLKTSSAAGLKGLLEQIHTSINPGLLVLWI